jgi:PAS domain S-box-containing protein
MGSISINFDYFIPYGLPSLITMVVCLFLAALTFEDGKSKQENRLFVIFSILYAVLNLGTSLITMASASYTLEISRLTHMFFVFIVPVTVQFVHGILEIKNRKLLERLLYFFSFLVSLSTHSNYYYFTTKEFFFGHFPIGGPAFHFFLGIAIIMTLYCFIILAKGYKNSKSREQKVRIYYILLGMFTHNILSITNSLPVINIEFYPLGSFGFIPLCLMSYGMLRYKFIKTARNLFLNKSISRISANIIWSPVIFSIIFYFFSSPGTFHPDLLNRIFPVLVPPILTLITCFSLAAFCFLKGDMKLTTNLFGLVCLLWGGLSLDITMSGLLLDETFALKFVRLDNFFLVLQIGIYTHLVYRILGKEERFLVYTTYAFGIFLMPLTQTSYFYKNSMNCFYFGFFAKRNLGFDIFGIISILLILWASFLLIQSLKKDSDPVQRQRKILIVFGSLLSAVLGLGNIPALHGFEIYPLGNFMFIPVIFMAYGIFRFDILKIDAYTRKRLSGIVIRNILFIIHLALLPTAFFFLKDLDIKYIYHRFLSYGIPPFISIITSSILSILALRLGRYRRESLLFSLICLQYVVLNSEKLLNCIITDLGSTLIIERLANMFFMLASAFYLHLVYILIKRRTTMWVIWFFYIIDCIMAPFALSKYYFNGTHTYSWGNISKNAILFDLIGFIWIIAFAHGIFVLYKASRQTDDAYKKQQINFFLIGFVGAAVLTTGNILPINGYDIYPSGTFAFIPLLFLGYAFFSHGRREVMDLLRLVLLWALRAAAVLIIASFFYMKKPGERSEVEILIGLTCLIVFYKYFNQYLNIALNFIFGDHEARLKNSFSELTKNLSLSTNIKEINEWLMTAIFRELYSLNATMLVRDNENMGFTGICEKNPKQSIFVDIYELQTRHQSRTIGDNYPLLPLFEKQPDLITRQHLEKWITINDIELEDFQSDGIELIQPVLFEERLVAILFIAPKITGSIYSDTEQEFIHQLGLSLGPYLENAALFHTLEEKVISRTKELRNKNMELSKMMAEQEKTHIQLSESNEVLNRLIEESPFGIMMVSRDKKILRINNAAAIIFGHQKDNIENQICHGFICPEKQNDCPILDRGQNISQAEATFLHPVHKEVPILKSTIFIEDFILETFIDISERKQARNEIIRARDEAERANQIKSDFLANMSHEIRTPMNAIIGMTGISLNLEVTNQQRHNLKVIKSSSESLLGIINDILDFSKIEAGMLEMEKVEFWLSDILNIIIDLFAEKCAQKGIEFFIDVDENVPDALIGDPLRLRQIIVNLISNSIKFTREGEISLRIILEKELSTGPRITFSVIDSGIGLTHEQSSKLFAAFTQADTSHTRKFGGTGLGLAISKQLVEMMNGKIWVKSVPGKGSAFLFTAEFGISQKERKEELITPAELGGLKVLVVDDHPVVLKILETALSSFNFNVETAASGLEAIKRLKKNAKNQNPFQLLLLDWRMEDLDGIATLKMIKKEPLLADLKIIMISAVMQENELKLVESMGINNFLRKPVKRSILFYTIMELFTKHSLILKKYEKSISTAQDSIKKLKGCSILLVEDNEINQEVSTEILMSAEAEVILAGNGREAVKIITEHEKQEDKTTSIDAILMDIQMPEMDGYEATRIIRKTRFGKKIPIIGLTAHAMIGDRDQCLEAGMDDYVTKPIDPEYLLATLARWI